MVVGRDLKGERLGLFERHPAIDANTGHAADREPDRQEIARLAAAWKIGRRALHRANRAVWKGAGVEAGSLFCVMVVPQTDRILCHRHSPLFAADQGKVRPLVANCS